jgi:glutamate--cysteine ligase
VSGQYKQSLERFGLPESDLDLADMKRGIEKESLRVNAEGKISLSSHPQSLGAALSNPYITTDFSEALLEFITPAYDKIDDCLGMLDDIHRFTYQNLENEELLWVASMPCTMGSEEIPLAQYGNSNMGLLKTLYRRGLSHRYGSVMQTVAGIHYNFSMPDSFWPIYKDICNSSASIQDFRTEKYLHLIRNFHRYSWLLLYLFGASPAVCKCFVSGRKHKLQKYDDYSLYMPHATCLRMGDLGYSSDAQKSLFVCYNELETYAQCLHRAMHTPYPDYEEIGLKKDDEFLQINTSLLQLENEFYSTIRPKRTAKPGQRPLQALTEDGIEYVEVRALDLNPFLPLGIDSEQIRFLDSFLLYCLLSESPECNEQEYFEVKENIASVIEFGRDPELCLSRKGKQVKLNEWAAELVSDIEHSAVLLDKVHGDEKYSDSISTQKAKIDDPDLTPSGQVLKTMQDDNCSFYGFAVKQSESHKQFFLDRKLNDETESLMTETARTSLSKQKDIEAEDEVGFEEFLQNWNAS